MLVDARLGRDGVAQARGVEGRAGADDATRVAAGEAPDLGTDHVARVGDGHPDALEAGVGDAGHEGAGNVGGHEELAVAIGGGGGDLAGGVHDDVAAGQALVLVAHGHDLAGARIERQRVRKILRLARELLHLDVGEIELVGNPLHEQGVRNVRAHVTHAHDADLADECHTFSPVSVRDDGRDANAPARRTNCSYGSTVSSFVT